MEHAHLTAAEEARFRRLFEATYPEVRTFIQRRVRDRSRVDDVVFATYLVARRRIAQVPEEDSEAELWLYRAACRAVLNAERGTRTRHVRGRPPEGGRLAELANCGDPVSVAFARLHQDDRGVLLLAAWEGLSGQSLATVLGCTENAATTRLEQARANFAESLRVVGQAGEARGSRER